MVAANPNFRLPPIESVPHPSDDWLSTNRRWSDLPPPPTAEDLRIHAWINQRLAVLHREQRSLRAKARRSLFGNRSI
jgi:hypothetical protein